MSSKQKTTTNQTVASTPTNPQFVTDTTQGLAGQIQNLSGQDPQSFFAGPQGLNQQAFDLFGSLGSQGSGWLNQAAGMAGQPAAQMSAAQTGPAAQAQASAGSDYMGNYFNPYDSQVIGNATADLDRARQLTQNSNGQGAIAAGQYGGSRQGVLDANADEGFLRSVGNMAGQLRHQGFTTAAGLGAGDADRFTGTSQFNAGQTNSMQALQAQLQQQANAANQGATNQQQQFGAGMLGNLGQFGLGGMLDAGQTQQGIAQNQAGAPLSLLQQLAAANGSMPYGLFQGNTQTANGTSTQKGSMLDTIGKITQIGANAASLFSDERLKVDIRPIGTDERGRDWYDYRYAWDAPDVTRRGVMAQQILQTDPEAVSVHESGFLMVDYSKLGH